MIYEAATWWPGAAANYRWGRTPMLSCVAHYTVGRDSASIGLRGIFHFLVRRNGEVVQFCEADAKAFHAGDPYNSRGPGIEVEYLPGYDDTMFTDEQLSACGGLVDWLGSLGIPLDYYDDPANRIGDWHGFISHRSITSNADYHSDYWERSDWDQMVGATQQKDSRTMQIAVGQTIYGVPLAGVVDGGLIGPVFDGPIGAYGIPQSAIDWNSQPGRGLAYVYLDAERLAVALTPRATTTIPEDCPDCPPGLADATNDELIAELDSRLP